MPAADGRRRALDLTNVLDGSQARSPAWASECPLLGLKRTSISGGWRSAYSQKRKFASQPIPRETNQISHIMMPVDGAVHGIKRAEIGDSRLGP